MKNIKNSPIIFFDGNCNLCNFSVNFILKKDTDKIFLFSPLASNFSFTFFKENNFEILDLNTIVLYENNQFFTKSDAVLKIVNNFNSHLKYLYFCKYIPKKLRDFLYDFISKNRFRWFGKSKDCLIPTKENQKRFL